MQINTKQSGFTHKEILTMKFHSTICLLALAPGVALGAVCNADNVLRALRANSAKASPFCSTYTQPPPNQPLPTYVSQYPASRVSSACSCLITTPPTPTATPTPPADPCKTNKIANGDFQQLVNNEPANWIFAGEVQSSSGTTLATSSSANNDVKA